MTHPAVLADWESAVATVLRRAGRLAETDPDSSAYQLLTRKTVEGLDIPPLGTQARSVGLPPTGAPGSAPFTRGARSTISDTGWDVRALMTDQNPGIAAAAAISDLENGATSLWWTLGGAGTAIGQLAEALDGVYLDLAPVVLQPAGAVTELAAATAMANLISDRDVIPAPGTSIGADPISRAFADGLSPGPDLLDGFAELIRIATGLGIGAVVVDGTVAHGAGAGDAAEIGYSLAVAVAYLRAAEDAGADLAGFVGNLEFRYAATDDEFVTIAKFRAARACWNRVGEILGLPASARAQHQHAVTSRSMMTRYDPWNNLLRTTIAAFAAGVGGAEAVTVLPFDTALGVPDALGRRMSRNISALLIAESHIAVVLDPAGGSYTVEILTAELATAGWAEFQRIEKSGGIMAAIGDGTLRNRISTTVVERLRRIDTRRSPITGVTEFPNLAESLPVRRPWPEAPPPVGWAAGFEALRDVAPEAPVFLATLGSVAAHTARAGFATNAFAAGGIAVVTAGPTTGTAEVVAAYRSATAAQPMSVVCLAGPDATYRDRGADVIAGLRNAGATWIVLAGKPSGPLAELPIDDHVAVGDDILAFLERTRAQLHLDPKKATS